MIKISQEDGNKLKEVIQVMEYLKLRRVIHRCITRLQIAQIKWIYSLKIVIKMPKMKAQVVYLIVLLNKIQVIMVSLEMDQ